MFVKISLSPRTLSRAVLAAVISTAWFFALASMPSCLSCVRLLMLSRRLEFGSFSPDSPQGHHGGRRDCRCAQCMHGLALPYLQPVRVSHYVAIN
jgi:hypothetical protein